MDLMLIVLAIGLMAVLRLFAFPPPGTPMECLTLRQAEDITASGDSIATLRVPFPCRIHQIEAGVEEIDDATDVDIDLENGTVDLCDPLPAADSSAIVAGGVIDTPDTGAEDLAAGDILHMDVDITGGTAPTVVGCWAKVWVTRT